MQSWKTSGLCALGCALLGTPALAQFTVSASSYPAGTSPDATAAGDFDGDGDLDLAIANDTPDKISLLFNAGNGTFGAPVNIFLGSGTSPHTPVAGDLDGDGDIDIAVSLKNANAVQLIINNGGVFTPGASMTVGVEPRELAIGDLDGDRDNDLVVSNRSGNSVTVLRNAGGLTFSASTYLTGLDPRALDIGDVTDDGLLDIVVAAHDSEAVVVLRNLGAAGFTNHATLSTSPRKPSGVTLARLDSNGALDIAAVSSNNGVEFAVVFLNGGGGAFAPAVAYASGGLNADSIVAADMDFDGDQDLATTNQDSNNVSLVPNLGAGTFGAPQLVLVGAEPGSIVVADFDGNGATDLVTTNTTGNNVTVLTSVALGASAMHSMCSPGANGVNGCPCGNPSSGMGRGCNNSDRTGGARLATSGTASLSSDTLVFHTTGEVATGLSVVLQGTGTYPAGLVYGQGRRCLNGALKRLFVKTASGGSITAPGAGDPTVSARSAALGDPILAGQNRFYLVFYRDPVLLGGCQIADTFNASQGGRVTWTP